MHKVNKLMKENKDPNDDGSGNEFLVRVQLAALNQQWQTCESLYLDQGKFDDAIQLYTDIHKWQEALSLSERTNHPEHDSLKENFYQWLLQTGQEIEAGDFKEKRGDYLAAINIYLNGDAPTRAASAFKKMYNNRYPGQYDQVVFQNILDGLQRLGLHEKIGQFLEHFGHFDRALKAYCEGRAYQRATDLCRKEFPSDVVRLEEEWGDWLVKQRQSDSAVNHFIEAGQARKAIEAALASRQWTRVAEIAYSLDRETARDYYYKVAKHYESSRNYSEAEKYFVQASVPQEAVNMYASANHWEAAHRIAAGYMSKSEVQELYAKRGRELEANSKFKEAEKMYLASKAPDLAIQMYKSNDMFEQMIRLVSVYKKEDLAETTSTLPRRGKPRACSSKLSTTTWKESSGRMLSKCTEQGACGMTPSELPSSMADPAPLSRWPLHGRCTWEGMRARNCSRSLAWWSKPSIMPWKTVHLSTPLIWRKTLEPRKSYWRSTSSTPCILRTRAGSRKQRTSFLRRRSQGKRSIRTSISTSGGQP